MVVDLLIFPNFKGYVQVCKVSENLSIYIDVERSLPVALVFYTSTTHLTTLELIHPLTLSQPGSKIHSPLHRPLHPYRHSSYSI